MAKLVLLCQSMKMCAFANELYRKILLLQVLSGKLPEVLDFVKDLAHLEPASKVSYILMLDPCCAFVCLLMLTMSWKNRSN
jgi:hypothetical protein